MATLVEVVANWMVFFLGYVPSVVLDSVTKSPFGLSYIEEVSMFPAQKFVRDSLSSKCPLLARSIEEVMSRETDET